MKRVDSIGYFHGCTDGRILPWMFRDERDFIAGVNRIAICCMRTGVKVIAYVLMDNHVHLVLRGTMPQCKAFITLYKQLTGTWIRVRYGMNDFLRLLPTNILLLDTEERLLNTIDIWQQNIHGDLLGMFLRILKKILTSCLCLCCLVEVGECY